jgi:hypothetical protein
MKALGDVALSREDIDLSSTVLEVVQPLLSPDESGEPMEVDGEDDVSRADEL